MHATAFVLLVRVRHTVKIFSESFLIDGCVFCVSLAALLQANLRFIAVDFHRFAHFFHRVVFHAFAFYFFIPFDFLLLVAGHVREREILV